MVFLVFLAVFVKTIHPEFLGFVLVIVTVLTFCNSAEFFQKFTNGTSKVASVMLLIQSYLCLNSN